MLKINEDGVKYVLHQAKENDVKFIRLWFSDILGNLKGFSITIEELERGLSNGISFDGSSIEGFARSDERDLYAFPDPNTFSLIPWKSGTTTVARIFCDIYTPENNSFEGDPRYVLRRNLQRATEMGYTYYVAPEMEHFYFKSNKTTEPIDLEGYFDQLDNSFSGELRNETVLALEEFGIPVGSTHHEASSSQHEIDLRHTDALTMADTVMTYRLVVKEIAKKYGCHATFMPKPITGVNGNGMHIHQSLFNGDNNSFYDPKDQVYLSKIARNFIAGLLKHAREITAVTNQWVNSYKRLVSGFEAPTHISWALVNRADLIRVPSYRMGNNFSRRIEYRAPDPACNPYLAFSVMLAAGLEGIENNYDLLDSKEFELKNKDNQKLPSNLWEAILITENSELVHNALGDYVFKSFIENKKIEWELYNTKVTKYELDRYMPIL